MKFLSILLVALLAVFGVVAAFPDPAPMPRAELCEYSPVML